MKSKLVFVGDIFPANLHYTIGFGVASKFASNKGKLWLNSVKKYFERADIGFGNLESPLTNEEKLPQENCFLGSTTFATFLREAGINIVSVANNHILEGGADGFLSTINALRNANIRYVGENRDGTSNIEVLNIRQIEIGVAAFNAVKNGENNNILAEYNDNNVLRALNKMCSLKLDYKIISLHWGDEFVSIPSKWQIDTAHKLIDFGADIIVGHHPHVLQPIERYREGIIFYSLGNFIFDMIWSDKVRKGIVANIILQKGKEIELNTIPIYLGKDYIPHRDDDISRFEKRFEKNHRKMTYLLSSGERNYGKYYQRNLKLCTIYQRIMMKIFLLRHWGQVSSKTKKMLRSRFLSRMMIRK